MFISDLLQETYFSLSSNKPRSALTILGIVIGIGSVIALVSIGQGAARDIQNNIQSIAPSVSSRKQVKTTRGTNTNTSIYGITEAYGQIKSIIIETGNFIN